MCRVFSCEIGDFSKFGFWIQNFPLIRILDLKSILDPRYSCFFPSTVEAFDSDRISLSFITIFLSLSAYVIMGYLLFSSLLPLWDAEIVSWGRALTNLPLSKKEIKTIVATGKTGFVNSHVRYFIVLTVFCKHKTNWELEMSFKDKILLNFR